jgi:putative ribosome biogenesis GTPase RsgA
LWLVLNIARCRDAVTGRPTAGLVDQLTTNVIITDTMRENLAKIEDEASARLRVVVGSAGSGKSTLLRLFTRPGKPRRLGTALGCLTTTSGPRFSWIRARRCNH